MADWGHRASNWHSWCAWKCLNDVWHIVPVSHIPLPGACYTQIRMLLVGFPPLLFSRVITGALQDPSVTLWLWLACPAMPLGHSERDILSQSPRCHTGAVFSADQLLYPASFPVSVIHILEAEFRGTSGISCFAGPWKYLKGVQEDFIDNNWESPHSGCLKGSQAKRETMHLVLVVKYYSLW